MAWQRVACDTIWGGSEKGGHHMYLKQIPQKNGRVKLAVYESYREGKRTRQRTVRPLGYLDELEAVHDDPVAWGKAVAAEMTEAKRAAEQAVRAR